MLQATAELIAKAREHAPGFATRLAPTPTWEMAPLYGAYGVNIRERRYEVATGMALPFLGGQIIGLDPMRKRSDYVLNKLHELAHVMTGEVGHFLTREDSMSFSERRADLFAIADVVSHPQMRRLSARRKMLYVVQDVREGFRYLTEWSDQRLTDRAWLRVLLFREYGL